MWGKKEKKKKWKKNTFSMEILSGETIHRYRCAYLVRAFRKIIANIFYLIRAQQESMILS